MSTFEEFLNYCDIVICEEKEYKRYIEQNLPEFISFYNGSWKELFEAVLRMNSSDIDLELFAKEGRVLELKIAKRIGLQLNSKLAEIALQNSQIEVLKYLKENNIYVPTSAILLLIRKPNFRLIKLLDSNDLFESPEEIANEIVKSGRVELLNGLKIKPTLVTEIKEKQTLWDKYKDELIERLEEDRSINFSPSKLKDLPEKFKLADPENGKNIEWLIQSYLSGGISLYEDLISQVRPALEEWLYLKRAGHITKSSNPQEDYTTLVNICGVKGCDMKRRGKMRGLLGLYEVMKPYNSILKEREGKILNQITEQDYKVIFDDSDYKIIQTLTEKGSCYYGAGTRWCTAAKKDNQFSVYNAYGPSYIILPKSQQYKDEKYQMTPDLLVLMDETDTPLKIDELLKRHPKLIDVPIIKFFFDLDNAYHNGNTEKMIVLADQTPTTVATEYALIKNVESLRNSLFNKGKTVREKVIEYYLRQNPDNFSGIKFLLSKIKESKALTDYVTNLLDRYDHVEFKRIFTCDSLILPRENSVNILYEKGNLDTIKWLYSLNCSHNKFVPTPKQLSYSARMNHLDILKWARSLSPPVYLDESIINNLIIENANYRYNPNTSEILKLSIEQPKPIYPNSILLNLAIYNGDEKTVNFIIGLSPPTGPIIPGENALNYAIHSGNLNIAKMILNYPSPPGPFLPSKEEFHWVVSYGGSTHADVYRYVKSLNLPLLIKDFEKYNKDLGKEM